MAVQKALLQGGWMSHRTPEQRIRVRVTDMPTTLVDLTIQGQSGRCFPAWHSLPQV